MDHHHQSLEQGQSVWLRHDEEAWVRGTIASKSAKKKIKVKTKHFGTITVDERDVEFCSTTPKQEAHIQDLTSLPDLTQPALLASLHERFKKDNIYTFTGPILIAINPFKKIKKEYDNKRMLEYLGASVEERTKLAPHAWQIAHKAYQNLCEEGRNQSILVSGESGAGKTVSTKIVMNYLTVISHHGNKEEMLLGQTAQEKKRNSTRRQLDAGVSTRVLEANPLMEAFGNAKTLRNDNSSRFGKLIQLQFHEKNFTLSGASIDVYLLEKSRVVGQIPGERNYHIFYEMEKGLTEEQKEEYRFPSLKSCNYTNGSGTFKRADISDRDQFQKTQEAFDIVGFTPDEQDTIFRMMSGILHLGNIEFEAQHTHGEEGCTVTKASQDSLSNCARMLHVKKDKLENALTTRAINVGIGGISATLSALAGSNESFIKKHTVEQANVARDGIAMSLYEKMFSWIVWRINESIAMKSASKRSMQGRTIPRGGLKNGSGKKRVYYNDYSIGCLDIFGFEVFEKNSFEQLLINYTNEQLQHQFNEFVFELEQEEYNSEGIDWTLIDFPDNSKCLEMIEARPIGLLSLLDEECLYPKGSDQSLASKLYQNLGKRFSSHFIAERNQQVRQQFVVNHFAGHVTYDLDGSFCQKNKNELRQEAVDLLRTSKVPLFSILLPPDAASGGGSDPSEYFSQVQAKPRNFRSSLQRHRRAQVSSRLQSKTVSSHFKSQLSAAMNHIRASEPHYIRCLKSNDENVPDVFDRLRIEEQLCYSGVLEVVKVARAGYSTRFPLQEFASRFAVLAHSSKKNAAKAARKTQKLIKKGNSANLRDTCEKILGNSQLELYDDFQIGYTKIFLKPHAFSALEIQKSQVLRDYIVLLQRNVRIWLMTQRAVRKFRAAKIVQRNVRGFLVRRDYASFRQERKAAIQIQRIARGMVTRMSLVPILKQRKEAARRIKKAYKRKVMRDRLREIHEESTRQRAAVMLQGVARALKAQKLAKSLHAEQVTEQAALSLQSIARMIAAKKTKEMLEQEREAEERAWEAEDSDEDSDNTKLYLFGIFVFLFVTNPFVVVAGFVFLATMVLGGGIMLEAQQRQRYLEQDSRRYARRARRHRKGNRRRGREYSKSSSTVRRRRSGSFNSYYDNDDESYYERDDSQYYDDEYSYGAGSDDYNNSDESSDLEEEYYKSSRASRPRKAKSRRSQPRNNFFNPTASAAGASSSSPSSRSRAASKMSRKVSEKSRAAFNASKSAVSKGGKAVRKSMASRKKTKSKKFDAFDDLDEFGIGKKNESVMNQTKSGISSKTFGFSRPKSRKVKKPDLMSRLSISENY